MRRNCCWGVLLVLSGTACGDEDMPAAPAATQATNAAQPAPAAGSAPAMTPAAPAAAAPAAPASTAAPEAQTAAPPASAAPGMGATPAAAGAEPAMPADTAAMPAATPTTTPTTTPAGATPVPGESCTGCARFFLPMTAPDQRGDFELNLPATVDVTGTSVHFRLMTAGFTGNAGGVSVYVRDAGNFDRGFVWTNLSQLAAWTDVVIDFAGTTGGNVNFDQTRVAKIGVQLNSAGTFAGANYQNATVYLDSVTFSGTPAADLGFDAGIGDLSLVTATAPAGTSVGFVAP